MTSATEVEQRCRKDLEEDKGSKVRNHLCECQLRSAEENRQALGKFKLVREQFTELTNYFKTTYTLLMNYFRSPTELLTHYFCTTYELLQH